MVQGVQGNNATMGSPIPDRSLNFKDTAGSPQNRGNNSKLARFYITNIAVQVLVHFFQRFSAPTHFCAGAEGQPSELFTLFLLVLFFTHDQTGTMGSSVHIRVRAQRTRGKDPFQAAPMGSFKPGHSPSTPNKPHRHTHHRDRPGNHPPGSLETPLA